MKRVPPVEAISTIFVSLTRPTVQDIKPAPDLFVSFALECGFLLAGVQNADFWWPAQRSSAWIIIARRALVSVFQRTELKHAGTFDLHGQGGVSHRQSA